MATGTGLTYRWQRSPDSVAWFDLSDGPIPDAGNGGTYSGCTTNTLHLSNSTGLNGTFWRCVVTQGNGGKLATAYAYLTVS